MELTDKIIIGIITGKLNTESSTGFFPALFAMLEVSVKLPDNPKVPNKLKAKNTFTVPIGLLKNIVNNIYKHQ